MKYSQDIEEEPYLEVLSWGVLKKVKGVSFNRELRHDIIDAIVTSILLAILL